jgi:hypothetical protein
MFHNSSAQRGRFTGPGERETPRLCDDGTLGPAPRPPDEVIGGEGGDIIGGEGGDQLGGEGGGQE